MEQNEFLDLAIACLAGAATDEERLMLEKMVVTDASKKALFNALAENWQADNSGENVSRAWEKVAARLEDSDLPRHKRFSAKNWLAAAMLVFCAGMGWMLITKRAGNQKEVESVSWTKVEAGNTVKDSVWLPDGTYVRLNKGAAITYPDNFAGTERQVRLTGEGYFEVSKNPVKPFLIHVGNAVVKVIGTAFNVRENRQDTTVMVAVMEGLVLFSDKTKNKTGSLLRAGYIGLLDRESIQVSQGNTTNYLSWYSNRLIFENLSLPEVSRQLEHLYGVNIIIKSKELKSLALTANINHGSFADVISKIAYSLDVHYRISNSGTVELFK
ncbi:FecR family protein [Dyadobacter aurulentus]|uniref:FecR family protein n=1 Tax=Dyadobacter sp. UC 10 TaxID=2605428 RepID=UPI0011F1E9CE|nr:FecR family protein [Dyadobacter sp. UC 10]KAA0992670.1 DUF4974 domain-containing protein [Dyadobacter sp. UC 10]